MYIKFIAHDANGKDVGGANTLKEAKSLPGAILIDEYDQRHAWWLRGWELKGTRWVLLKG